MNTIIDVLRSRSSVSYLREPAPEGRELDLILEVGLRAPDHGRLRPWRFIVIRGDARRAFADLTIAALRAREPTATEALIERQRKKLLGIPIIIAVGARIRPEHKIPEVEQILSVGAAAMNMLNAVHGLGYGGIWVTGANCYDPLVASALGLDAPDRLVGFLFVGTPGDGVPKPSRPDLTDHVVEWTRPGSTGTVDRPSG